jgi:hypothetical protein
MSKSGKNEVILSSDKNEIIVECEPDALITVFFIKSAVQEMDKFYGPIFTCMVSDFALQFEAEKLNEKQPQNIQGLEQVTNYIIANLGRYPRGYCALMYGIAKTEKNLQGSTGAGARRAAFNAMRSIIESSGLFKGMIGTTKDLFEAIYMDEAINIEIKTAIPVLIIKGEKNEVTVVSNNCPYKDAYLAYMEDGILHMVAGLECINIMCHTVVSEIITKKTIPLQTG